MSENDGLEITQWEAARKQGLENASVPNGREIGTRKLLQLSRSAFHEITRFHARVRDRAARRKLAIAGPLEWLFDNYYIGTARIPPCGECACRISSYLRAEAG